MGRRDMIGGTGESNADRRISWDQIDLSPVLKLKFGVTRRTFALERRDTGTRARMHFENQHARLLGTWRDIPGFGSRLSLELTNVSEESIRVTRLMFPAGAGIHSYVASLDASRLSFLRNGYQSWSTVRSYLPRDKPLRPWLQLVSLASSNLANLPSNVPGVFSSDMYALVTDRSTGESFLVGQDAPFDQFFYIKLNLYRHGSKQSYFELTYDFGRKLIPPGRTVTLSAIIIARGTTHGLQHRYFRELRRTAAPRVPAESVHGWSSWYYYYTRITPEIITRNIEAARRARDEHGARIDFIQIDDGYEEAVGDWLRLRRDFDGEMRRLADTIREAGFRPGLWIAPFVASRRSELLRIHPEYALRDEYGSPIVAGFNFFWRGRLYYGLDVTNPRFEEYMRRVIRTLVGEWGYPYLKCDFLFGACLRGGTHHDLELSRAEVLRRGMALIREEAEAATRDDVFLVGCGMPLVAGIGTVDAMRVGPDTGGYWIEKKGALLRTGAMVGVRNAVRNSVLRAPMHRALWLNDPDCLMLRTAGTKLTPAQRRSQINALALTGGLLLYSDDFTRLKAETLSEITTIQRIAGACFNGRLLPWDMMERELPAVLVNTAGYLGVFNMGPKHGRTVNVPLSAIREEAETVNMIWDAAAPGDWGMLEEVWSGERVRPEDGSTTVGPLSPFESRLYRLVG
ncbi:MAG: glycoside hydrolase family 36 protein [Spirochaetaceae bacterium]